MYSQIAQNKRKTIFLIALFIGLIGLVGWAFAWYNGTPYLTIGVIIGAAVYAIIGYFASAKIALAMSGAKPIEKSQAPELYRTVENLSITAGLPMPKVYIMQEAAPNAFATGRDPEHAVVAVTTGILDVLDDQELEGVLAHEMSHIQNYDIRVMGIVLVLVTVIAFMSDIFIRMMWFGGDNDNRGSGGAILAVVGIIAAIIAPLVATLLKLSISRKREYLADASGALLTRYPDGLASALEKIAMANRPMRKANTATAHLFISNPLGNNRATRRIAGLFSTHPPTEERVRRLREMGSQL